MTINHLKLTPSNSYHHASASASTSTTTTTSITTSSMTPKLPLFREMQRQGTNTSISTTGAAMPENGIWSTILQSVAASRIIPTKNILILGEPGVGKSTLVHYLKQNISVKEPAAAASQGQHLQDLSPSLYAEYHHTNSNASTTITGIHQTTKLAHLKEEDNGLGLGYTYNDIIDDDEHEIMARLGIYQLSLASPEFTSLLRFALSTETLSDACVLILLDWSRPWKLIETLQQWMTVLHRFMDDILMLRHTSIDSSSSGAEKKSWHHAKAVVDELKEKLELFVQSYTEPSESCDGGTSSSLTVSTPASSTVISPRMTATKTTGSSKDSTKDNSNSILSSIEQQQVMLPLSPGCLTDNLGLPIIVVCTKSEAMANLEQAHKFKEEHFDYIQQTLRCICLKYGAALFYTSTMRPYTYHRLREYILHRTCVSPTTSLRPCAFRHKAEIIERDTVMVPSGWDSWKKIRILKEGFDCEQVNDGWDEDLSRLLVGMEVQQKTQQKTGQSIRVLFEETIIDPESEEDAGFASSSVTSTTVVCEDEQSFLSRYFEQLQKQQPSVNSGHSNDGQYGARNDNNIPGVVGPLSVTPLSLTRANQPQQQLPVNTSGLHLDRAASGRKRGMTLEKLLTLNNATSSTSKTVSANTSYSPTSTSYTPSPSPIGATSVYQNNPASPSSPLSANAIYNGDNTPSNETLANFFQSLLKNSPGGTYHHHHRTRRSSTSRETGTTTAGATANGLSNGTSAKNGTNTGSIPALHSLHKA